MLKFIQKTSQLSKLNNNVHHNCYVVTMTPDSEHVQFEIISGNYRVRINVF